MNVLVTGGAGFLGSWLCEKLVQKKYNVYCLDNLSSGKTTNIDSLRKEKNFEFIRHDIISPFGTEEKFDIIYHLACPAAPFQYQKTPVNTLLTNSAGSLNVLELARKNDCPVFISSTSEVYGDPDIVPTPETHRGYVSPIGIRSCYDEGKRYSEALFKAYERQYGIDTRIVRIFNTYGPKIRGDGMYGRVIPNFIRQVLKNEDITIYGDGNQTRSFCYVEDLIRAFILVGESEIARGEIFNIGNPHEITVNELADTMIEITGAKSKKIHLPLPEDDPKRRCPDINKITQTFGWKPEVSLKEGLQRTIEWIKTN
ncbi:MAG: SDR family oxidoreductase [Candidatus Nanoarchaeia archaeon]|nr:SDR family oxidoreductase [Candidatus Nanoarchaeia archaeon]